MRVNGKQREAAGAGKKNRQDARGEPDTGGSVLASLAAWR